MDPDSVLEVSKLNPMKKLGTFYGHLKNQFLLELVSSGKEKPSKKDGQRRTKQKRMPPKLAEKLAEKLDQKTLPCFPFSLAEHNAQPLLKSMCPPSSSIKNHSFLILIQKRSMSWVIIQKNVSPNFVVPWAICTHLTKTKVFLRGIFSLSAADARKNPGGWGGYQFVPVVGGLGEW